MNEQKRLRLVKRLLEKTRAGELTWEKSSFDANALTCRVDDYTMFLRRGVFVGKEVEPYVMGDPIYSMDILNGNGTRVDIADPLHDPQTSSLLRRTLEELYDAARRSALGQDQAIDDLLRKLG